MTHRSLGIVGTALLVGAALLTRPTAQSARDAKGPYARIAMMRARDGHSVEWEAGYIRHLEWHRQAKDTFGWYSYSVWASTERQRWIIDATFGHTAAELANPVSPAEDELDNMINVLPHAQFLGNGGLRVPAGVLARDWCADSHPSSRVHNSRTEPGGGKAFRGGARRGPINTAGRDALVSHGRGRRDAAL